MIESSPQYFASHATDLRTALAMIHDASGLLARLLDGGHSVIAGRLAGAFRNSGRDRFADEVVKTMGAAPNSLRKEVAQVAQPRDAHQLKLSTCIAESS